jgi:hypothetical protein
MNHRTRSAVRLSGVLGWACVAMLAGAPEAMAAPDEIVLRVRRIVGPHLTKPEIDALCGEVNRIWAAYRVRIEWHEGSQMVAPADPAHLVVFFASSDSCEPGSPCGWLAALERVRSPYSQQAPAGRPDAVITVSLQRAQRMADAASRGELAEAVRMMWARSRLPILMGRAVAHEIGHYLLESREHSEDGLMRPQYMPDDVRQGQGYGLDAAHVERIHALWSRRTSPAVVAPVQ